MSSSLSLAVQVSLGIQVDQQLIINKNKVDPCLLVLSTFVYFEFVVVSYLDTVRAANRERQPPPRCRKCNKIISVMLIGYEQTRSQRCEVGADPLSSKIVDGKTPTSNIGRGQITKNQVSLDGPWTLDATNVCSVRSRTGYGPGSINLQPVIDHQLKNGSGNFNQPGYVSR